MTNDRIETESDDRYLQLLLKALRICTRYTPKFGRSKAGLSLNDFQSLYRNDPFYQWLGLNHPLVYSAHKAAGGITSLYRQLGIGCQWVFNQILQDYLGLSQDEIMWKYVVPGNQGSPRFLTLDARIDLNHVRDSNRKKRLKDWVRGIAHELLLPHETIRQIKGVVFEVRQGYKSKDSKRQNADIAHAANAYANLYVPVLALFSLQIDDDVAQRYSQAKWLLLRGATEGTELDSTYIFFKNVIGYDLADFFQRHFDILRREMETVMTHLLEP